MHEPIDPDNHSQRWHANQCPMRALCQKQHSVPNADMPVSRALQHKVPQVLHTSIPVALLMKWCTISVEHSRHSRSWRGTLFALTRPSRICKSCQPSLNRARHCNTTKLYTQLQVLGSSTTATLTRCPHHPRSMSTHLYTVVNLSSYT